MSRSKILDMQLEKLDLNRELPPSAPEAWQKLLSRIDTAYRDFDQDRYLLERSLNLSSDEMRERLQKIKYLNTELSSHNKILEALMSDQSIETIMLEILKSIELNTSETRANFYEFTLESPSKLRLITALGEEFKQYFYSTIAHPEVENPFFSMVKTGQSIFIQDIQNSSSSHELKKMADLWNWTSCWSYPVYDHKNVFCGVLCVYSESSRTPSQEEGYFIETQIKAMKAAYKLNENRVIAELSRLQTVNASKLVTLSEMAAGVAHEVNNPLAVVSGYASNIHFLLSQDNINRDELKESCDAIERSIGRIAKIVSGLQYFSQEASQGEQEPHRISKIFNDTLMLYEAKLRGAGVDLKINIKSEDFYFNCRAPEISQMLANLIQNSYEAVKNKTEKWILIETEKVNDTVVIRIVDSGSGLTPEVKSKLFHPFFTTKPVGEGIGMGLSICRGIVESHMGKITYSDQSKNTEFVIIFPHQIMDTASFKAAG